MERLLWICLAGAIGTGARYLIALWAAQRFGSAFRHGTLIATFVSPTGGGTRRCRVRSSND